jgi:multimeric flavodoxin WrbA
MKGVISINVLAIIGSKRKNGNTSILIDKIYENISSKSINLNKLFIKDYTFEGCLGCNSCHDSTTCIMNDDMQKIYKMMDDTDVLILASPTYYYNVTADMKKLIDRFFCLNIFDKNDRTLWTSKYHESGKKAGIVVSICEQQSKEDIGFTTLAMKKPLQDIGYNIIYTIEAINSFYKGDILKQPDTLIEAKKCAETITDYLRKKEYHF